MKILLKLFILGKIIKYKWQTIFIVLHVTEHFFKMADTVKKENQPILTEIAFDNTDYIIWMGEYKHDLLTRLSELSTERNYWRRKALGLPEEDLNG